jgi:hypothetical protein
MFVCENGSTLLQHYIDVNFAITLAYHTDVFEILNLFNICDISGSYHREYEV